MDVRCHLPGHVLAPLESKLRNVEGKSLVDLYQKGGISFTYAGPMGLVTPT